ncbi:MAG: RrF2 family transcriptional regulator [Phycisphaerae bacterium]
MIALSRKTDYALIALSHLARCGAGGVVSARRIAELYSVPLPLLMNVLKRLSKGGFVESVRGARGGYRLARPAVQITLAGLIQTMDSPVRLVRCVSDEPLGPKEAMCRVENCPLRWPAGVVHRQLQEFLERITLADIAASGQVGSGQERARAELAGQGAGPALG